jgi:hypothetical protein
VPPLFASRTLRIAASVVFVVLSALGFLPLFGGPGYEQSLASGLVAPAASAIAMALEVSAAVDAAPIACFKRGLAVSLLLAAVAFATAILHGLRVGICDFWGGTVFFLLTAGCGAVVGGTWGVLVGEACRGRRRRRLACVAFALAGPLAGIATSVWRFYGSPMIFAYDPFFGYFSGTLYDTVVDVRPELWTYRAASLVAVTGVGLVCAGVSRGSSAAARKLVVSDVRFLLSGLVALLLALVAATEGPALGHWQTSATIARALGGRASGPRCDVFYPESVLAEQADLLVRDCEEELAADERRLGARLDGRLSAFVFADANEKRRLMGAAETSIAKPWRREVYVKLSTYPHPVLGHEIAHVVAGSFAPGPFHVGGGLIPDPGLIEGVAVATSPDDDELTDAEWARAMLDVGLLPRMKQVFSLGFLGQSADKSYTVAGAFVSWVLGRWGAAVVRTWYGGGSLEELTGKSWSALDGEFGDWLRKLPMPVEASAYAHARFDRPSVWARPCPHVVDALDLAADKCRDEHRFARASGLYAEALSRDPTNWHARLDRAKVLVLQGEGEAGRALLEGLMADPQAPRTSRDRAEEALADSDLARGLTAHAAQRYRAIAERTLDEDAARTLEVKALAAEDPMARRAILDLLVAEPGRSLDPFTGALSLGTWAARTEAPLAEYLVGKNLTVHSTSEPREGWARAAAWLDRALRDGAPTPRIGRELLRQRAICACALYDTEGVARVEAAVKALDSPFAGSSGGRRDWVLRLTERCDSSPARAPAD